MSRKVLAGGKEGGEKSRARQATGKSMCKGPEAGQSMGHVSKKQKEVNVAEGLGRGREKAEGA